MKKLMSVLLAVLLVLSLGLPTAFAEEAEAAAESAETAGEETEAAAAASQNADEPLPAAA